MEKVFLYKIYNSAGTFLTTWNDVASSLNIKYEINSGLSPLTIRLPRPETGYGETEDVNQGNLLKIYVFDKESGTDGVCIYSGILVSYIPIVEGGKEYVDVVFYSHYWDLANKLLEDSGDTEVAYLSQDPSDILKDLLDKYHAITGTVLNYSTTSIEDTTTTVSYTYNTDNYQNAIKKLIELCPDGWYFRVGADDYIYLAEMETTPTHKFTIGKDIISYQPEKKFDNIINTIYFRGGDTGGGVYLYKKYTNSSSVDDYGIRAKSIVDQRVIVEGTAQIMANRELDRNASPETRVVLKIMDSNLAYDETTVDIDQSQLLTSPIRNADFENAPPFTAATTTSNRWINGTAAGGTTPNDPQQYGWGMTSSGTFSVQYDSTIYHNGNYSLKASTLAATSYVGLYPMAYGAILERMQRYCLLIKPLTTYKVTYWMKTNYVSGDSSFGATFNVTQYNYLSSSLVNSNGGYIKTTTDWTEYTFDFISSSSAYYLLLSPRVYGHSGSTANLIMDAWFDDINIEEYVDGSYVKAEGSLIIGGETGTRDLAQQFEAKCEYFEGLYIKKFYDYGTFTGNIQVEIVEDDADYPVGKRVGEYFIDNITWMEYDPGDEIFIPIKAIITPGNKYWIKFSSNTKSDANFTAIVADFNGYDANALCKYSQIPGYWATSNSGLGTSYWQAQQFIAQRNSIDTIGLKLRKVGSPTGNLTVAIETDTGANAPSGTVLATTTVNSATLDTKYQEVSCSLACNNLTVGQKYWITMKGQAAWDASNDVYRCVDNNRESQMSLYYGGGSWSTQTWLNQGYFNFGYNYWFKHYRKLWMKTVYTNQKGYDIESIKVGQTCQICNATLQSYNLWDESIFDIDAWDFDITNAAGQQLQIMSIDYYPDYAILELSNKQPDISKRIEDIDRNWQANVTVDNPATPT